MTTNNYTYIASCIDIDINTFNKLMKNSKPCSGSRLRNEIKRHLPFLYNQLALDFYNPFEHRCRRKKGLAIYVHSGIEYFIRID